MVRRLPPCRQHWKAPAASRCNTEHGCCPAWRRGQSPSAPGPSQGRSLQTISRSSQTLPDPPRPRPRPARDRSCISQMLAGFMRWTGLRPSLVLESAFGKTERLASTAHTGFRSICHAHATDYSSSRPLYNFLWPTIYCRHLATRCCLLGFLSITILLTNPVSHVRPSS